MSSSLDNPQFDPPLNSEPQPPLPLATGPFPPPELLPPALSPIPPAPEPIENPVWSGWDVLALIGVAFLSIVAAMIGVSAAAHRYLYPKVPWRVVVTYPALSVVAQIVAYMIVLGFMYLVVKRGHAASFGQAIRWNWPRNWTLYLFGGLALALAVQLLERLLPVPKSLPIDEFFRTPREAWLLSAFGITLAPLLEELFFRGFLYPVLVRRLGIVAGVLLTAAGFALIHAQQLLYSWGPVLGIFLVGLALTLVRAAKKSVAGSLLVHMAYNAALFIFMFAATDGFRHLEKLNQ